LAHSPDFVVGIGHQRTRDRELGPAALEDAFEVADIRRPRDRGFAGAGLDLDAVAEHAGVERVAYLHQRVVAGNPLLCCIVGTRCVCVCEREREREREKEGK